MEPSATIFSKKLKRKGKEIEYTFFDVGSRFRCKCPFSKVHEYFEELNKNFKIHHEVDDNILKLYGDSERLVKKLVIFCSLCQCVKSKSVLRRSKGVIAELSYFEDTFWFSKILDNFERGGYWSVCRVVSSFRKLYRLDK